MYVDVWVCICIMCGVGGDRELQRAAVVADNGEQF